MVYGFLHCHSHHSQMDSTTKIDELCKTVKEMGAKAISLTDHGVCTGHIEFMDACKKYGLNGIPGVEAYLDTEYAENAHLLLLPQNYTGYQELCHAVTESNKNQRSIGGINTPVMTKEILANSFVSGNVIATSACISGVLSAILLKNQKIHHEIEKLERKQERCINPNDPEYLQLIIQRDTLFSDVSAMKEKKKELQVLAGKKYKQREKSLKSLDPETELYDLTKEKLEKEKNESMNAAALLPKVTADLKVASAKLTRINNALKKAQQKVSTYQKYETQKAEWKQQLMDKNMLVKETEKELLWFVRAFHGKFYVELQYHGLDSEAYVMPILAELAQKHHIEVVATNDVHILRPEDAEGRSYMRSMRFERFEEVTKSDRELYLKDDQELTDVLKQILPLPIVAEAIGNIRKICDSCRVVIPRVPDVHHYPVMRGSDGKPIDAEKMLRKKAYDGLYDKMKIVPKAYLDRLEYELHTIIDMGFSNYLLIVADYIQEGKRLSREKSLYHIGYGVGPGRGSGAGSLVNYALGITALDPIQYGLLFERFLNKERVSMPDIDVDFAKEIRSDTIRYVQKLYGEESVACIRTVMTQQAKDCIHNMARVYGYKMYPQEKEDDPGRSRIRGLGNQLCGLLPDDLSTLKEQLPLLKAKCSSAEQREILQMAATVENTIKSFSFHAAGVIIGDGKPLSSYIPVFYNKAQQQWAVSCNMTEAEDIGLLKMDFLGLINLDIISECIRRIMKNTGIAIDPEHLPFEKEVFENIFAKGETSCVFQVESPGMKKMLREFQPDCFEDLILLIAAYRPGPMDFIPDIIAVKHGRKKPKYILPQIEKILSKTYGQCIYQEQLMSIFHECAGFSLGEADIIRRYMSKKKVEKFLQYKPQFIQGIVGAGALAEDAEKLWNSLEGFAKYAFNKSHAAVYALICYITGWLKYHYPAEYMCAVLNHTDVKKIPFVIQECIRMGLHVSAPDINTSVEQFSDCDQGIIYGLGVIKGMKQVDAQKIIQERSQNGKYPDIASFLLRTDITEAAFEKMIRSGSFSTFLKNRSFLLASMEKIIKTKNEVLKKQKALSALNEEGSRKDVKKAKEQLDRTLEKYQTLFQLKSPVEDAYLENLNEEKKLLGAYITSNPLQQYEYLKEKPGIGSLSQIAPQGNYIGVITNLEVKKQRDGRQMAIFTLEDWEGSMECICFSNTFSWYEKYLYEGSVIQVQAVYNNKKGNLIVKKINACKKYKRSIFIAFKDRQSWESVREQLLAFEDPDGHPLILFQEDTGGIWEHVKCHGRELLVNEKILDTNVPGAIQQQLLFF